MALRVKLARGLSIILIILSIVAECSAGDIYEERLNQGLRNSEPYSYLLIKRASSEPNETQRLIAEAERLSPDFPVVYFEQARLKFPNMFQSMGDLFEGLKSYKRNFFWLFSLSGLLYTGFIIASGITILIIEIIRFSKDIPLFAHDTKESRGLLSLLVLLIGFSLIGPIGFLLILVFISGLYLRGANRIPIYIAFIFISLCPVLIKAGNLFFSEPTPKLRTIVEVNEARGNDLALEVLNNEKDYPSMLSYGLALKRAGRFQEAVSVLSSIEEKDLRVYNNLGNIYWAMGNASSAIEAYKKAEELGGSVRVFYNLSQIYRDSFKFSEGDEYFQRASKLNKDLVSEFTATTSREFNRFLIDETLSRGEILRLAVRDSKAVFKPFIPPLFISISAIILLVAFIALSRVRRARRCSRCLDIFCERCAKKPHREDICPTCYESIIKPVEESPKDRVAKLLRLQKRQKRTKLAVKVLSYAPPGLAQIYAGRVLDGSVYVFLFIFSITIYLLNPLIRAGLGTFSHSWLDIPMAGFSVILYIASNLSIRRRLQKGWL